MINIKEYIFEKFRINKDTDLRDKESNPEDDSNWSKGDISKYCMLSNINCTFSGYGYAINQNISQMSGFRKYLYQETVLQEVCFSAES